MDVRKVIRYLPLIALIAVLGCGPNRSILESANRNSAPAANTSIDKSSLEQDLDAMSNADFKVVFVLRRKDGAEFDAADRGIVRQNTSQANRRVSADGGRAVIVGSNFPLDPANIAALKENFQFEDHSPAQGNSNSNGAN
jgi:hypothetical protein